MEFISTFAFLIITWFLSSSTYYSADGTGHKNSAKPKRCSMCRGTGRVRFLSWFFLSRRFFKILFLFKICMINKRSLLNYYIGYYFPIYIHMQFLQWPGTCYWGLLMLINFTLFMLKSSIFYFTIHIVLQDNCLECNGSGVLEGIKDVDVAIPPGDWLILLILFCFSTLIWTVKCLRPGFHSHIGVFFHNSMYIFVF